MNNLHWLNMTSAINNQSGEAARVTEGEGEVMFTTKI